MPPDSTLNLWKLWSHCYVQCPSRLARDHGLPADFRQIVTCVLARLRQACFGKDRQCFPLRGRAFGCLFPQLPSDSLDGDQILSGYVVVRHGRAPLRWWDVGLQVRSPANRDGDIIRGSAP